MNRCQLGILAEANLHSYYLLFNAIDGMQSSLKQQLASFHSIVNDFSEEHSESELSAFVAIGADYWSELYPDVRPKKLESFPVMEKDNRAAPNTPFDVFIHIRSDRVDVNHLVATQLCHLFEDSLQLAEQIKGFRYLDGRDLTGFVDGTENPHGAHRKNVAIIAPEDDATFAGGSYIHIQRYRHRINSWNELPVNQQEDVIGRTKVDNVEYKSADKPAFSHVKRTGIKGKKGESIEILRQSMPYGQMRVQGLFFISCAKTPEPFTQMLESMIYGDEQGEYDKLLDYTVAETGAAFFAPSIDFFKQAHI